jgi:hypothetical protein
MLLLFLCPGIIAAPVCPVSYQLSSSPPASSGSAAAPRRYPPRRRAAIRHGARSFTLWVWLRDEIVTVSRLKACTATDAARSSPRRRGRPPAKRPGGSASVKRVSFSHPLVSPPSTVLQQNGPGLFSYPAWWFLHARSP